MASAQPPQEIASAAKPATTTAVLQVDAEIASATAPSDKDDSEKPPPPWQWKVIAVLLVTLIRFGGAWGAGLNTSMKTALKKELRIDNTKFALLASCEDFMKTVLIIFTGAVTDRIGGAATLFYGNIVYSLGSLLIAVAVQVKSFNFMMGASVIMALGDLSTQVAQYQVFTSWFAPGNGFASTLGFEIMVNKCGALAGAGSANPIAVATGKISWVYWIAFMVNLFTNACCAAFYWFSHKSKGKYGDVRDPATNIKLKDRAKKFDLTKLFELPWTFWLILAFSLFTTSTSVIFNANATEFAQHRFNVPATQAGWFTAVMKYGGFAIIPAVSIFSDLFGQRISFSKSSEASLSTGSSPLTRTQWSSTGSVSSQPWRWPTMVIGLLGPLHHSPSSPSRPSTAQLSSLTPSEPFCPNRLLLAWPTRSRCS